MKKSFIGVFICVFFSIFCLFAQTESFAENLNEEQVIYDRAEVVTDLLNDAINEKISFTFFNDTMQNYCTDFLHWNTYFGEWKLITPKQCIAENVCWLCVDDKGDYVSLMGGFYDNLLGKFVITDIAYFDSYMNYLHKVLSEDVGELEGGI